MRNFAEGTYFPVKFANSWLRKLLPQTGYAVCANSTGRRKPPSPKPLDISPDDLGRRRHRGSREILQQLPGATALGPAELTGLRQNYRAVTVPIRTARPRPS